MNEYPWSPAPWEPSDCPSKIDIDLAMLAPEMAEAVLRIVNWLDEWDMYWTKESQEEHVAAIQLVKDVSEKVLSIQHGR